MIFDDLLAHAPARFSWLLHHEGEARWDEGWRGGTIVNGPAEARVEMMYPANLILREVEAPANDNADATTTYAEFTTAEPSRQQNFVTVITPNSEDGGAEPRCRLEEAGEVLAVRIEGATQVTDVYLNRNADGRRMHNNSNATVDGWETDAYLLAITRPRGAADFGGITRMLVVGGELSAAGGGGVSRFAVEGGWAVGAGGGGTASVAAWAGGDFPAVPYARAAEGERQWRRGAVWVGCGAGADRAGVTGRCAR